MDKLIRSCESKEVSSANISLKKSISKSISSLHIVINVGLI